MNTHSNSANLGAAHGGPVVKSQARDPHFKEHVRRYLFVFYALLFGTLITVGASYIPFGNHHLNIAVALFIAVGKASLVACYFMHLISERKMIYGIMAFTAFFFIGLMFLTLASFGDFPRHTVTR
jgi:cytochrome c oxidase subunit IV